MITEERSGIKAGNKKGQEKQFKIRRAGIPGDNRRGKGDQL